MLLRPFLISIFASIVTLAQQDTASVGTRVLRGEIVFPNGAAISEAQADVSGTSLRSVIADHPYSADLIIEGSTLTQPDDWKTSQKAVLYRDLMGRTRAEVRLIEGPGKTDGDLPTFVEIIDPIAGFRSVLDPNTRTASRSLWPPAETEATRPTPSIQVQAAHNPLAIHHIRPSNHALNESLGTENIQGLMAEGTRTSITYHADSTDSNQPFTVISEHWTSAELALNLLSSNSDPRYGTTRVRVTNLLQSESDLTLFQVPPDFQIVDKLKPEQAAKTN